MPESARTFGLGVVEMVRNSPTLLPMSHCRPVCAVTATPLRHGYVRMGQVSVERDVVLEVDPFCVAIPLGSDQGLDVARVRIDLP